MRRACGGARPGHRARPAPAPRRRGPGLLVVWNLGLSVLLIVVALMRVAVAAPGPSAGPQCHRPVPAELDLSGRDGCHEVT